VDATINVCGVSVFRLTDTFDGPEHFQLSVARAKRQIANSSFVWNYAEGNHFISWSRAANGEGGPLPDGDYLVMHASPAEFKNQFNGLYPMPGNWYSCDVHTIIDDGVSGERILRILTGEKAERFTRWAHLLEHIYHERQEFVASLVAPGGGVERVLSVLHYGMPTPSSVAIGCQWLSPDETRYPLLTRPHAPFYVIDAEVGGPNTVVLGGRERVLAPHGLGVRPVQAASVSIERDRLTIGRARSFGAMDTLREARVVEVRPFTNETVDRVLDRCPGTVVGQLEQLDAYYRNRATQGEEHVSADA
jgi:hypothetical protein